MPNGNDRTVLAAFFIGSAFAGGNAVAVRFSNRELPALWGAGLRFALAAIVLILLMAALRVPLPRGRALLGAILFGAFNFAGAFAFTYYGLVRVQAGFGQTLLAMVPLLTLILAVVQRQERIRIDALVGGFVALIGVAFMTGASVGGSVPLLSVLAILGGATCFAEAAVLVRLFPKVHPVARNAVGMTAGALLLLG
ncbi:MAG: EamA family transporter, partial [Actinomycetota bacterium]